MNGNSQALARRFVELGFKCEIIPYFEDYTNSNHFKYTKQQSDILCHTDVNIYNGYPILAYLNFLGFFINPIINLFYKYRQKPLQTPKATLKDLVSRTNLTIIGTGISPLLLKYLGKHMDIYYPSSQGVEFVSSPEGQANAQGFIKKIIYRILKREMISALKDVKLVVNSDVGLTHDVLCKINLKNYHLDIIPFVEPINQDIVPLRQTGNPSKLVMFSRLHWVRPKRHDESLWNFESKNNDRFIYAFAKILANPKLKKELKLTIIEYGKDVERTRQLVKDLAIQDYIEFHPIVRKEDILTYLNQYDILVGEFYNHNISIGGTGLEALQLQKPFLNGGWLYPEAKRRLQSEPPVYFCNNEIEIYDMLVNLTIKNYDPLLEKRKLFYEHLQSNGIIKSWLEALQNEFK